MKKFQLLQQPERAAFLNGKNGGDCAFKAILNQRLNPLLDIQYGMILVWDYNINGFDSPFNFHVWNVNEATDTVYDGFDNLADALLDQQFKTKPFEDWKITMVDGTNLKCQGDYLSFARNLKHFNKNYKGYDAIYIYNFGFRHDRKTLLTWDYVDRCLDEIEEEMEDRNIFELHKQSNELIVCI